MAPPLGDKMRMVLAACACCGRSGEVGVGRRMEPGDDTGRVCGAPCSLCGPFCRETLHVAASMDPDEDGAAA